MAEIEVAAPDGHEPDGHVSGVLKWFDTSKGYGFVACGEGKRDVFLHVKELRRSGIVALNDGAAVRFKCNDGPRGPFATEIKILHSGVG